MFARSLAVLPLLSGLSLGYDVPMRFEPCLEVSCGAAAGNARFFARGAGYNLFLTSTEAVLDLQQTPGSSKAPSRGRSALRMKLAGARTDVRPVGMDELPGRTNYFIGNDPKRWRTGIPNYAKVAYRDVYPGVTVVYYSSHGELEFDLICSPGADPNSVRLAFEGAGKIEIDSQGILALETPAGRVQMRKPHAYQVKDGVQQPVSVAYARRGAREVAFEVNGEYDAAAPLVVDPVLVYSTFLGTRAGDNEVGRGVAVDSSGSAYVTGQTGSAQFPVTSGAFQRTVRSVDAYVTKLSADGKALVYSTYLGGDDFEEGTGIKVDAAGNAYVTGRTYSSDFPVTAGAVQRSYGGGRSDVFVTKLNATGSALLYSTYLGGSDLDRPYGIAIDARGSSYVAGATRSSNFPVGATAFQRVHSGSWNTFVTKLDAAGTTLAYSTYLGGEDSWAFGIAVDASGSAYVAGETRSSDFPFTPGAFRRQGRLGSAFAVKFVPSGNALAYSALLEAGSLRGIAVDESGNAYVTGVGGVPATPGAYQTAGSMYVAKLNAAGSGLAYATYVGGIGVGTPEAIAVDRSGNAYIAGYMSSGSDFPVTADALQLCNGGQSDAFLTRISPAGSAVTFSTFLGDRYSDGASGIDVDSAGDVYLTGFGGPPTTPGSFRPEGAGSFVAKIGFSRNSEAAAAVAPFITGVLNGASFRCGFQYNSWITIRGYNFAATSRTWSSRDIIDGRLPTNLDGVSVDVGGKPAAIYYVSPTQINALAPAEASNTEVTVTNAKGVSPRFQAGMALASYSPAFFTFDPQSGRYPAAAFPDGTYAGPPGLFGAAVETRPAKPGEIILLYGTGFGASNPPVPPDRVFTGAAPLVNPVEITIGGVRAQVQFAGMVGAGLCQFNVVVPDVPDGDQELRGRLRLTSYNVLTPSGVFVSVRR